MPSPQGPIGLYSHLQCIWVPLCPAACQHLKLLILLMTAILSVIFLFGVLALLVCMKLSDCGFGLCFLPN